MKKEILREDFGRALTRLSEAVESRPATDLQKAGCIQYFEFCFELAWKSIRAFAADSGVDLNSPKSAFKFAFESTWIDDEQAWLEILDSRNRMAHTYDAGQALRIYDSIPSFLPHFRSLLAGLNRET